MPPLTKTSVVHTKVHEISTRTPDYLDILTVLLPVATFLLGYFFTGLVEKRKEKRRLADVKQYFIALAESIISEGQEQVAMTMNAASRLQHLKGNTFSIGKMTMLNDRRIQSIADIDLYKIFVVSNIDKLLRIKHLNMLSGILDVIGSIKDKINSHNNEIASITEPFAHGCANKVNDIIRKRNSLYRRLNENQVANRINAANVISIIDDIIIYSIEANPVKLNEILYIHDVLAKPFYDSSRLKYINKNDDNDIRDIFIIADELRGSYVAFMNKTTIRSKSLINLSNKLTGALHDLSAIVSDLKY